MAAVVAIPHQLDPTSRFMMPRSFKGDQDGHVDQLIVASQTKQVHVSELFERPLVPFFNDSDSANFQPLQKRSSPRKTANVPIPRNSGEPHHGLKRGVGDRSSAQLTEGSSPPRKENQVLKAKHKRNSPKNSNHVSTGVPTPSRSNSKPVANSGAAATAADHSSGAHSDGELSSKTHRTKRTDGRPPAAPKPPKNGLTSHKIMPGESNSAEGTPSKASCMRSASGKFAGPAFTNSPMPDSLPIPPTSLLMHEAADRLRSRLLL